MASVRFTLGRFFPGFDHASGFWDGAAVRIGDDRGVSGGVAAGFEPLDSTYTFTPGESRNLRRWTLRPSGGAP